MKLMYSVLSLQYSTVQYSTNWAEYHIVQYNWLQNRFCVLRISTTDGADDQLWFDQ